MTDSDFYDGYIERKGDGRYEGELTVERINLSPVEGVYFHDGTDNYLWIKRKPILEYDMDSESYRKREREPRFECYLKKQVEGDAVAYKGEFTFMHFKFSVSGVWDSVLGYDNKKQRINLYIERLPMSKQTIINSINERKRQDEKR